MLEIFISFYINYEYKVIEKCAAEVVLESCLGHLLVSQMAREDFTLPYFRIRQYLQKILVYYC